MVHVENAALRGAHWFHKGYSGSGNVGPLLDDLQGRTAIVCGNAWGVFQEFDFIFRRADASIVFAANDVGMYLPHVDHWVSLHASKLDHWVEIRRNPSTRGVGNKNFHVHDAGLHGPRDWYQWKGLTPLMALSGMFAAQIAYLMGCDPIILCGCPNDKTPRFWEMTCDNQAYVNTQYQIKQEMAYKPEFKKAIRSMSGWSKEFFGAP